MALSKKRASTATRRRAKAAPALKTVSLNRLAAMAKAKPEVYTRLSRGRQNLRKTLASMGLQAASTHDLAVLKRALSGKPVNVRVVAPRLFGRNLRKGDWNGWPAGWVDGGMRMRFPRG